MRLVYEYRCRNCGERFAKEVETAGQLPRHNRINEDVVKHNALMLHKCQNGDDGVAEKTRIVKPADDVPGQMEIEVWRSI